MGKVSSEIDDSVRDFLLHQRMFFVATAPSGSDGHVNLSPKGLDGFRILGPKQVVYIDYTGSGVETIAHLRDNGRIVLMFCAFDGPPKILRLHGSGRVIESRDPEFAALLSHFVPAAPARSIIRVDVDRVADSCGYGVPLYDYRGEREQLGAWSEKKGAQGIERYQREKNAKSIDGLPGLRWLDHQE